MTISTVTGGTVHVEGYGRHHGSSPQHIRVQIMLFELLRPSLTSQVGPLQTNGQVKTIVDDIRQRNPEMWNSQVASLTCQ